MHVVSRWLTTSVLLAIAEAALARTVHVRAGESIQAAIDAAAPGSRILVEPGVYHEGGAGRALTVTKDGIRLVGRARGGQAVVLEQAGTQEHGVWVSPADSIEPEDDELPPCGVSGRRLRGFTLEGFTIQGFGGLGVYLACVDRFAIRDNVARRNGTYAVFPVRSTRGRITRNVASDTTSDACLYVGQSEKVVMDHNRASRCVIGLQVENSRHVVVRDNESTGNTTGVIVDVVDARQVTAASDNRVTNNFIHDNNLPNPARGTDSDTGALLPGFGIIVDSADSTVVAHNRIEGEKGAAVTLVYFCLGRTPPCPPPDIDPNPDGNRFVGNRFRNDAVDFIWRPGAGRDNCVRGPHSGPTLPACR